MSGRGRTSSVIIKGRNRSPAGRDHSPVKINNENNIRISIGHTKTSKRKSKPKRNLTAEEVNSLLEDTEEENAIKERPVGGSGGSIVLAPHITTPAPIIGLHDAFNQPTGPNIMPTPHHRFYSVPPQHSDHPILEDQHSVHNDVTNIPVASVLDNYDDEMRRKQELLEKARLRNEYDMATLKPTIYHAEDVASEPEFSYSDAHQYDSQFEDQNPSHAYIDVLPLGELVRQRRLTYNPETPIKKGDGISLDDFYATSSADEHSRVEKPKRYRRTKEQMSEFRQKQALAHHHKQLEKARRIQEEAEKREQNKPTKAKAAEAVKSMLRKYGKKDDESSGGKVGGGGPSG